VTDWFARPVLHVADVETSLRFYVDGDGFTNRRRYDEDGRVRVTEVDRQGYAIVLASTWPEKIGKGLMFISLKVEAATCDAAIAALDGLRAELKTTGVPVKEDSWGIDSRWSMIPPATNSSSTTRVRLTLARLPGVKRSRPAAHRGAAAMVNSVRYSNGWRNIADAFIDNGNLDG